MGVSTKRIENKLKKELRSMPVDVKAENINGALIVCFTARGDNSFQLWRIIQEDETIPSDHPQTSHTSSCDGFMPGHFGPSSMSCRGTCRIGWVITRPDTDYLVSARAAIKRVVDFGRPLNGSHAYRFETQAIKVELNPQWLVPDAYFWLEAFLETLLGKTEMIVSVGDQWSGLSQAK